MRTLLLVAALLVPASASAQTLTLAFDRSTFPQLGPETPVPADLDGNTTTREWVQSHYTNDGTFEIRGVALRGNTLCTGTWFRPFEIAAAQSVPWDALVVGTIFQTGTRHRYVVFGIRGYYEIEIGYGC